jgi:excisionase family DNA binding protein
MTERLLDGREGAALGLDELAVDPTKAAGLSPDARGQLVTRCAAVLAALAGTMATPVSSGHAVQNAPTEPDRLLTVPEAATLMGFAPSYVYEMCRRGDLPAVRRKKYVRIRRSAIEQWIAENEQSGLDRGISNVLSSYRDGNRNQTRTPRLGLEPSRTRRQARRTPHDGQPLGT